MVGSVDSNPVGTVVYAQAPRPNQTVAKDYSETVLVKENLIVPRKELDLTGHTIGDMYLH